MTDGDVIAVISACATVITGLLTLMAYVRVGRVETKTDRVEAKTDLVSHNVTNDHAVNLRDDMDTKHDELLTMLRRDVGGMREDIRLQRRDHADLAERVHDLEITHPKQEVTP